jgi:hypothetical protein
MNMTVKMGVAAVLAAAMGLGACTGSVVGGNGETAGTGAGATLGAGGAGATTAGEQSAAELGCVSGSLETWIADRYPMGSIAVDALYVYWADHYWASQADYLHDQLSYDIVRAAKADGSLDVLESGLGLVTQVAVDDAGVYWSRGAGDTPSASFALLRVPKAGGAAATLYDSDLSFYFTAADPDRVFLLQERNPPGAALMAVPKAGGPASTLAVPAAWTAAAPPVEDEANLYWWDQNGMRIAVMSKAGGAPQTFAEVTGFSAWVPRIVLDAAGVYWVVSADGGNGAVATFFRAPKVGGAPVALGTVPVPPDYLYPINLAVDDRCLYWTEYGGASNPQTGAYQGKVRAIRKSDGLLAAPISAEPAPANLLADESGLYLTAPAATMTPPGIANAPGLMGAVQRVAR